MLVWSSSATHEQLGAGAAAWHRRHQRTDVVADVEHGRPRADGAVAVLVAVAVAVIVLVAVVVARHRGHAGTDSALTSKPLTGWSRYGKASR